MNPYIEAGYISVFSILTIYSATLMIRIRKIKSQIPSLKRKKADDIRS